MPSCASHLSLSYLIHLCWVRKIAHLIVCTKYNQRNLFYLYMTPEEHRQTDSLADCTLIAVSITQSSR